MKKTKKTVLLEFWYKMCVTLKIYAKLNKANWKLKFKPQKVQDPISNLALELHQNSVSINCDKFFKITAASLFFQSQNFTLYTYLIYHFFVFCFFLYFFFSLFCTTQTIQIQSFRIFRQQNKFA